MRTVEELIAQNVPRDHMTLQEERTFVDYWFDKYEATGFLQNFHTFYGDFKEYSGKKFKVIERCNELNADLEVLPIWNIMFEDGNIIGAFPEEICVLENEGRV